MMHQENQPLFTFHDRPLRDSVIQKDEIISLMIDIHLLSADEFIRKYCSITKIRSSAKEKARTR